LNEVKPIAAAAAFQKADGFRCALPTLQITDEMLDAERPHPPAAALHALPQALVV
jgi:hypothetical protein